MTNADEILALDRAHVWHPYTATDPPRDPLVVVTARGSTLVTHDGRRLLDGNSSWWVCAFGHGHPRLRKALVRQSRRLGHCALAGIVHEPAARLAAELVDVAPRAEGEPERLTRVFYSDDGSTAIEAAVKLAVQCQRQRGFPARTRFLALAGAFHGDTLAGVSLGGVAAFREPFVPLTFKVVHPPDPDTHALVPGEDDSSGWSSMFEGAIATIEREASTLAAVVIEPVLQGASGMRVYDPRHVRRLREVTRRHGVLLIADEVFTGYGRTGAMFACEHARVVPDLLCVGKGFSGGLLPMAATVATEDVFDAFRGGRDRAFLHGHSYTGNPLGAAVAREALAVMRDEAIVERVRAREPRLRAMAHEMAAVPGVMRVRSLGMTAALDLGGGGYGGDVGWRVYEEALARGAYLRPLGDTVYVAPPLTIRDRDLDRLLAIFCDSVKSVLAAAAC